MRCLSVELSSVRPILRNRGNRELTNTSKVAIDRSDYHDRWDTAQTNHAENENAAHGGGYDNQPGHANVGCDESGGQSTYQACPIQKYQLNR